MPSIPEHYPVMLSESLDGLAIKPDGVYLDSTAGLGGHSGAIARKLETGLVIANDRDLLALELARTNTADVADRILFHYGPFSMLASAVAAAGRGQVDGLLADLGVSRYQLLTPDRGFSFLTEGPLDMRMDQSRGITAEELVNKSAEKALADWIYQHGEERRARKIARAIVRARPIRSTLHLADVVERVVPRTSHLHPATQTFMALRMVVNQEPEELDALLELAPDLVKPGGRIVIISFMSLEDRKVKESFRDLQREKQGAVITKKPLVPSEEECRRNPPSRSAKLRVFELA
jgi:16S rRNA (cytosine1402-N4)-methyltransferase